MALSFADSLSGNAQAARDLRIPEAFHKDFLEDKAFLLC